ncbi:MAG: hypothetical protein H0U76_21605 [Ktedonobacteraceae bacterium]|nr:hypothetical protein [Ktedonobacteraceae bacterium]
MQKQDIQQATITLPYFNYEVPVVYLADGTAYLPVRALCRMLGLPAETHIPRWQKLVIWFNARKLPLQTARGQRMVWCLHMGALPFLCACFNWSLVSIERREQLRHANNAWLKEVAQAQRVLLDRYRSLRRDLFTFLDAYSDAETWLDQWALHLSATLDATSSRQFETLLSQGKTLISEATAHACKIVQEQTVAPIIGVVTLDAKGAVTEIETQPLFPVVPSEDREQLFASVRKLARWHQDTAAFIGNLERSQNGESE